MSSDEPVENLEFIKVEKLSPSSRGINIIVKVVSKSEVRNVFSRSGEHRVADGLVGDETGCIYLSLWNENIEQVNEGETLNITNAYINLFRGNMRLNIGRYGSYQKIDEEVISEVNSENNVSSKQYEQERRYRPYRPSRPRYGDRGSY